MVRTQRSTASREHAKYAGRGKGSALDVDALPNREVILLYLQEFMGYSIVPGRSGKYITLEHPTPPRKYFVGKNGGIRFGTNVSSSQSTSPDLAKLRAAVKKRVAAP